MLWLVALLPALACAQQFAGLGGGRNLFQGRNANRRGEFEGGNRREVEFHQGGNRRDVEFSQGGNRKGVEFDQGGNPKLTVPQTLDLQQLLLGGTRREGARNRQPQPITKPPRVLPGKGII